MLLSYLKVILVIFFGIGLSILSANTESVDSLSAQSEISSHNPDALPDVRFPGKPTFFQNANRLKTSRIIIFYSGIAALDLYGFYRLQNLWYKSPRSSFHFQEFSRDMKKFKQMDKIGHMMHPYYASHFASRAYQWSGYPPDKAIWYGAIFSSLWMLQIKIADGFFKDWGFSVGDFTANLIGAFYAGLQQKYPRTFSGVDMKVSYHKSTAHKQQLWNDINRSVIDDYEGMTFWLTFNVYDLLPARVKHAYPEWLSPLGIAVGHSARNIARDYYGGYREIYIGLDLDLEKIPVGNSGLWKILRFNANFIRLPLPAVRIHPRGVWYGFYF